MIVNEAFAVFYISLPRIRFQMLGFTAFNSRALMICVFLLRCIKFRPAFECAHLVAHWTREIYSSWLFFHPQRLGSWTDAAALKTLAIESGLFGCFEGFVTPCVLRKW